MEFCSLSRWLFYLRRVKFARILFYMTFVGSISLFAQKYYWSYSLKIVESSRIFNDTEQLQLLHSNLDPISDQLQVDGRLEADINKHSRDVGQSEKTDKTRRPSVAAGRSNKTQVSQSKPRLLNGPTNEPVCWNDTLVLVMVNSHPGHFAKRQAIRQTWGSPMKAPHQVTWPNNPYCCPRVRLFFVLGWNPRYDDAVTDEHSMYKDIFRGDFNDHYHNMTLKSLFAMKTAVEKCSRVKYLLKSDDDMFINVPNVLQRLETLQPKRSVIGSLVRRNGVMRRGKWAMPAAEYPSRHYPPYMMGGAYVITADVVPMLLEASHYVPHIFIDDVYITGILVRVLNVTLIDGRTRIKFVTYSSPLPSQFCVVISNVTMSSTNMPPKNAISLWNKLNSTNRTEGERECTMRAQEQKIKDEKAKIQKAKDKKAKEQKAKEQKAEAKSSKAKA